MIPAIRDGLDGVEEDILAVRGPELEPAEESEELRGEARDARLVGGLLAGLPNDEVDLGARLGDDLLDPSGVNSAVRHQLGQRDPRDLAADGVEARQDDALGGVVDDQVDPGRLLEGADVPALAADDPALHLVRREVDDGDRVLRGVVGGDALDRRDDHLPGALLRLVARLALDDPGEPDGVGLGLDLDGFEELRLRLLGGHVGDPLERFDLLVSSALQLVARLLEVPLPVEELPVALLEHVGALVELLVAGKEAAFEAGEVVPTDPCFFFGLALEAELLVLGLEDQLLLLCAGLGDDPSRLVLRGPDRLGGPQSAGEESEEQDR